MVRFLHFLVCAAMVMVRSLRDAGLGDGGVSPSAATALLHETAKQVANDTESDLLPSMPPAWQGLLGPGRSVGEGSFGEVSLHDLTGCSGTVAMKALTGDACEHKEIIRGEVGALLAVRHPNVMRMYDFFPRDPKIWCKRKEGGGAAQCSCWSLLEVVRSWALPTGTGRARRKRGGGARSSGSQ
mmetsp:Transcript_43085/g.137003  ORF Transcript_43085/g.137003 Transcript_43085/m.137003 type:complete len:184 (+) Transcript_43085:55-606(+)